MWVYSTVWFKFDLTDLVGLGWINGFLIILAILSPSDYRKDFYDLSFPQMSHPSTHHLIQILSHLYEIDR